MKKILILMMLMFFVPLVIAVETPPFTVEFRGVAKIGGVPVADNTEVSVWANNGELMMDSTIAGYDTGYYNHLEIKWDNPLTTIDEGVTFDDTSLEKIMFKVGDKFVTEPSYFTVISSQGGQTLDLDLNVGEEKPLKIEPEGLEVFVVLMGLVIIVIIIFFAQKIRKK